MTYWWFLLILLFILVIAAAPTWPYSRRWGYYPTGIIGLLLVILVLLLLFGWLPGAYA